LSQTAFTADAAAHHRVEPMVTPNQHFVGGIHNKARRYFRKKIGTYLVQCGLDTNIESRDMRQ
jgi:hypothetical protein